MPKAAAVELVDPRDDLLERRRARGAIDCGPNSVVKQDVRMAQQSFKDEVDINNIMAKYDRQDAIDLLKAQVTGRYVDLASYGDYHAACNKVLAADAAFLELPAKIRNIFDNDPAKFLEFVHDPKNSEKAVEIGLAAAPKQPKEEPKASDATPPAEAKK